MVVVVGMRPAGGAVGEVVVGGVVVAVVDVDGSDVVVTGLVVVVVGLLVVVEGCGATVVVVAAEAAGASPRAAPSVVHAASTAAPANSARRRTESTATPRRALTLEASLTTPLIRIAPNLSPVAANRAKAPHCTYGAP